MFSRRDILKAATGLGAAALLPKFAFARTPEAPGVDVNDVQSQLNLTRVNRVATPTSLDDIQAAIQSAQRENRAVSVAGGRHAMGGQQFGADTLLLDMTRFNRMVRFDKEKGLVEVEGGIEWPELIDGLRKAQPGQEYGWGIREKQSGVDRVTIGGSLAANVHGRGLRHPPIVSDVESFVLVDAHGKAQTCSRRENPELFSLAIGGYGLFGIITHVTLRLAKRTKVQRVVDVIAVKDLIPRIDERMRDGFLFGDCQYATSLESEPGVHPGIFACYRAVGPETTIPANQKELTAEDWAELYRLGRTQKKLGFERYAEHYRSTNGQVYWSDIDQLAGTFDGYRRAVDVAHGTEMITELYVNRDNFLPLLAKCREDFLKHNVDMTYGTIRFIEKDSETFLNWARESSVCIICNLHVAHSESGKAKAAEDFRRMIDRTIEHGGRYYLTYHRWATRKQVEKCYPQFVEFLRLKRKYDPNERFQSEWYRHYKTMFADML
ncbi:MAG: FAD-binding oxidoreductase [Gemmataceae bacterium]